MGHVGQRTTGVNCNCNGSTPGGTIVYLEVGLVGHCFTWRIYST